MSQIIPNLPFIKNSLEKQGMPFKMLVWRWCHIMLAAIRLIIGKLDTIIIIITRAKFSHYIIEMNHQSLQSLHINNIKVSYNKINIVKYCKFAIIKPHNKRYYTSNIPSNSNHVKYKWSPMVELHNPQSLNNNYNREKLLFIEGASYLIK